MYLLSGFFFASGNVAHECQSTSYNVLFSFADFHHECPDVALIRLFLPAIYLFFFPATNILYLSTFTRTKASYP